MKKGCAYCNEMHLNRCPYAFSDIAKHCGNYDNKEAVKLDKKIRVNETKNNNL